MGSRVHGKYKERIHKEWRGMLQRCENPNAPHYEYYGGRGISVCEEWHGTSGFVNFYEWAMQNGYSDALTLDRVDNDAGYSPENCRWVTHMENCHNRGVKRTNNTGCAGVEKRYTRKGQLKYRVVITTNYKRVTVGHFDTLEKAIAARRDAERKYWGKEVVA